MYIEATRDALFVSVGARFGKPDAERLREAFSALGPRMRLTLDFTAVRESDDSALATLATMLSAVPCDQVELRGLTTHQRRLLKYLGFGEDFAAAVTGEP